MIFPKTTATTVKNNNVNLPFLMDCGNSVQMVRFKRCVAICSTVLCCPNHHTHKALLCLLAHKQTHTHIHRIVCAIQCSIPWSIGCPLLADTVCCNRLLLHARGVHEYTRMPFFRACYPHPHVFVVNGCRRFSIPSAGKHRFHQHKTTDKPL